MRTTCCGWLLLALAACGGPSDETGDEALDAALGDAAEERAPLDCKEIEELSGALGGCVPAPPDPTPSCGGLKEPCCNGWRCDDPDLTCSNGRCHFGVW